MLLNYTICIASFASPWLICVFEHGKDQFAVRANLTSTKAGVREVDLIKSWLASLAEKIYDPMPRRRCSHKSSLAPPPFSSCACPALSPAGCNRARWKMSESITITAARKCEIFLTSTHTHTHFHNENEADSKQKQKGEKGTKTHNDDRRDGHGRYAVRASGSKKQNEHLFLLCLTRQIIKTDRGRKHAHFVARVHAPSIYQECRDYRQQKCRDQVSGQKLGVKLNVTKHVIDSPTVWVSSLIISVVYVIWFQLRFSHECWWLKQWHLAALFTARKKNMIMLAPALS